MANLWTEDPRRVALYDVQCAGREDHDFYLDLAAELDSQRVVDVGCGTGVFAVDAAQRGHQATGIDPAEPMLDAARTRLGGELVEWILGDAGDGRPAGADLVIMMGHVAQYFVNDAHWAETLVQVRELLDPGGRVAFEVRNPLLDWESRWTRENTTSDYLHPDGGTFTSWVQVIDRAGSADSYQMTHEGHAVLPDGSHLRSSETLRFRSTEEIEQSLDRAGFVIEQAWGDWDHSPSTPTSTEFIVVASC